jgi:hypothetical protein
MTRPRAADDFAAIRSRMEQLRRERAQPVRHDPVEPSDQADVYPRRRSAEPVDERALLKRIRDRAPFSR